MGQKQTRQGGGGGGGADDMMTRMVKHDQVNSVEVRISADEDVGESRKITIPITRGIIVLSDLQQKANDGSITSIAYEPPGSNSNNNSNNNADATQSCPTTRVFFPPAGPKASWSPWPVLVASDVPPRPPSPAPKKSNICVMKENGKKEWKRVELTKEWYLKKDDFDVCCGMGNGRLWSWNDSDSSFVENPVETIIHPPREGGARAWLHPDIKNTYQAKS